MDNIFDLIRTSGRGCDIIKRDIKDALGIPQNDSKDAAGTVVSVLGFEIVSTLLRAHMPRDKLARVSSEAASLLQLDGVSHKALQRIVGFLQLLNGYPSRQSPPPVALRRPRLVPASPALRSQRIP